MSIVGGLISFIINGYEQPPIGRFIALGKIIDTGELVIFMLLLVVIL